jgi:[ribosomal protein S5]-alanine N-acetyltransferase
LRILRDGEAELSYWVHQRFRGRGYATRAVEIVIAWASSDLAIRRFVVEIELDNFASVGVARHARFTQTGIRRDERGRQILVFERLIEPAHS